MVPTSRGLGQFYANRSAIHLKSRFCTSAARHPSLHLTTHTSRHGLHRLTVRRFADVWTSPLIEEDFYVPEHERIAVTTMPPATHPTPAALDTPRSPAPQIPVKKSKARLAPSDLTTVEKANYYMKEALKDETPGEVVHLWKLMKRNNLIPNRDSYKLLVRAFAMEGQADEPLQLINEMDENNIQPDLDIYNGLLNCLAEAKQGSSFGIASILLYGVRHGLTPNATSQHLLVLAYVNAGDFRRGWRQVEVMKEKGIQPSAEVFHALLSSSMLRALPRNTIQVVEEMVRLGIKLRKNDVQQVLDICLRNEQLDDLQNFIKHMEASNTPISEKQLTPILVFAGRRANPEFTLQLKEKYVHAGCTRHAAHTAYESLIRSQANAIRFPEAFKTLAEMHKEGLRLRSHASRALVEAMSRDCRVIDDVYVHVEQLQSSEDVEVDPDVMRTYLNLIIEACSQTQQFSKAFDTFAALESFGLKPDVQSFHAVLKGICSVPGHLAAVTQVYDQLAKNDLRPTAETFHHVISAFLVNNELQNGLELLGVARDLEVNVGYDTCAMIVRKMARVQHTELLERAQQAMESLGYRPDPALESYLSRPRSMPVDLDTLRQRRPY